MNCWLDSFKFDIAVLWVFLHTCRIHQIGQTDKNQTALPQHRTQCIHHRIPRKITKLIPAQSQGGHPYSPTIPDHEQGPMLPATTHDL